MWNNDPKKYERIADTLYHRIENKKHAIYRSKFTPSKFIDGPGVGAYHIQKAQSMPKVFHRDRKNDEMVQVWVTISIHPDNDRTMNAMKNALLELESIKSDLEISENRNEQ